MLLGWGNSSKQWGEYIREGVKNRNSMVVRFKKNYIITIIIIFMFTAMESTQGYGMALEITDNIPSLLKIKNI